MKKLKITTILMGVLMMAPLLQSCLKDDEEIFDENPSARLQAVLSSTKQVLMGADQGWLFEMYPESGQGYGGYAFVLRFDDEKVYARTELAGDSSYEEASYYKMTDDDGPVLSFDTYNTLLHFLSTPTSGSYQAFQGEFEFVIMEATADLVTLRGKKTGNIMYMRRMNESAESYLDKVFAIEDCLILSGFEGLIGNAAVTGTIDTDYRQMTFVTGSGEEEETQTVAFTLTDKGLRFYAPVEIGGTTLPEMTIDPETNAMTGVGDAVSVALSPVFPEGWRPYDAFGGKYLFNYYFGSIEVTLTAVGDKSTYLMSGLNDNFDVAVSYKKSSGQLEITSQQLGTDGSYGVWMCGWDANYGYITWGTDYGIVGIWNGDEEHPVYTFTDNGQWGSYEVNSFALYRFNGAPSSSTRVGTASTAWRVNGSYQIPYIESLTKID